MSVLRLVRQAARALARRPAFLVVAVISLAIGIGAPAAMFAATRVLLLQPLPYPDADRLVALHTTAADGSLRPVSMLEIEDWNARSRTLEGIAGFRRRSFGLSTADGGVQVVQSAMITAGLFRLLGTPPALGREFTPEEVAGDKPLVLLSDRLWRDRFHARPDILGAVVRLNDAPRTVVGVAPPGPDFVVDGHVPDLWIPLSRRDYGQSRGTRSLEAIGRRAAGATAEQTTSELDAVGESLARDHPETNRGVGLVAIDLHEARTAGNRRPLLLLLLAAGLLLSIACTNVAGLQLERGAADRLEVAVHRALGAGSGDLTLRFLSEGILLALVGAAAGLLVAEGLLQLLPTLLPLLGGSAAVPAHVWEEIRDTGQLLGFTLPVLAGVAIVFALVPLVEVHRRDLRRLLSGRVDPAASSSRFRAGLLVAQVAVSVVLLLGAGLLLRSFVQLTRLDPGFRTEQLVRFGIGLPEARYDERGIAGFHRQLTDRLGELPGVEGAAVAFRVPLTGVARTGWQFEGEARERRDWNRAGIHIASPGYTDLLSIPRIAGRDFRSGDDADAPRVVQVSRSWVRIHSAGEDPLGRRLELSWRGQLNPPGTLWEIVGVVGDVHQSSLEEAPAPGIYLPMAQFPAEGANFILRTSRRDHDLQQEIRAAVADLDPGLEQVALEPLSAVVRRSLGSRRLSLTLAVAFAAAALALTLVGVYGLVAAGVTRRRRELAIRGALGATNLTLLRIAIGQGVGLCVAGLLVGVGLFAVTGRSLAGLLYGVQPLDPWTIAGAGATLLAVGALASGLPAIRAGRASLAERLRHE